MSANEKTAGGHPAVVSVKFVQDSFTRRLSGQNTGQTKTNSCDKSCGSRGGRYHTALNRQCSSLERGSPIPSNRIGPSHDLKRKSWLLCRPTEESKTDAVTPLVRSAPTARSTSGGSDQSAGRHPNWDGSKPSKVTGIQSIQIPSRTRIAVDTLRHAIRFR